MKAYLLIDCPRCGYKMEISAQPDRGPGIKGLEVDIVMHQYCWTNYSRDEWTVLHERASDAYTEWLQPPEAA